MTDRCSSLCSSAADLPVAANSPAATAIDPPAAANMLLISMGRRVVGGPCFAQADPDATA
jgi:hypothetical protein